jgi:hypothetical protein
MRLLVSDPILFKKSRQSSTYPLNHFEVWYDILADYGKRSLTIKSDKLPAIAGIAQLMQRHFACEYGAGLWKEDLSRGLCWYLVVSDANHSKPINELDETSDQPNQEYIAPSWSWASVTSGRTMCRYNMIHSSGILLENCVKMVGWEILYPPGATSSFGHVKSGILTLSGYVREALLTPTFKGRVETWLLRPLWEAHAIHPVTATKIGEVALNASDIYKDLNERYQHLPSANRGSHQPSNLDPRALPVSYLVTHIFDENECRHVFALVLIPHNIVKQEYRRIGLLYTVESELQSKSLAPRQSEVGREETRQIVHIV